MDEASTRVIKKIHKIPGAPWRSCWFQHKTKDPDLELELLSYAIELSHFCFTELTSELTQLVIDIIAECFLCIISFNPPNSMRWVWFFSPFHRKLEPGVVKYLVQGHRARIQTQGLWAQSPHSQPPSCRVPSFRIWEHCRFPWILHITLKQITRSENKKSAKRSFS